MNKNVLDDILTSMLNYFETDISDLNITAFKPLQVEHEGKLSEVVIDPPIAFKYISPYQSALLAISIIGKNKRCMEDFVRNGSCDLSYQLGEKARFRINIFFSKGNCSIVLRRLATTVPSFDEIKSPKVFNKIIEEKNGLILITGATGSGKSTTLAAILRAINENKHIHVVTLEDPIEFVHKSIKATFNQREQGSDFDTFPNALRAALRQAPKVILVGEMRDRETMEIGLTAAETGHLVLSTLHTVDAGQTINRVIGMFDKEEEDQIRLRLSETVRWIVCQRLLPKKGGGRVAAHEIMGSNLRTTEIIREGESIVKTYFNVIEGSEPLGWQTFESCLTKLYKDSIITEEEALLNTTRKSLLRQKIDYVKSEKGEATSDIDKLGLDEDYVKRIEKEFITIEQDDSVSQETQEINTNEKTPSPEKDQNPNGKNPLNKPPTK